MRAIVLAALAVGMTARTALGGEPDAVLAPIPAEPRAASLGAPRSAAFDGTRTQLIADKSATGRADNFAGIREKMIGQSIGSVIQMNAKSVEVITFGGRPSVTVIRGGGGTRTAPAARPVTGDKVEIVSFADRNRPPVTVIRGPGTGSPWEELFAPARGAELDLVAFAVDGAESSHGTNLAMWRPEWRGPQGPMQVSEAAAIDVGGGDRFDMRQNRLLGRAYLAHLYRRYGNWRDAVVAYNWGPGNLDLWIAAGRPPDALPVEVERYRDRVLRDAGLHDSLDLRLPQAR